MTSPSADPAPLRAAGSAPPASWSREPSSSSPWPPSSAAVVSGSWIVATVAAATATVLGVAATRITYTEVADTRRSWARDRAEQAQAYAELTDTRTTEQALYVADTSGRLARHEATITRLESRLADAAVEVANTREELAVEQAKVLAVKQASEEELRRVRRASRTPRSGPRWRSSRSPSSSRSSTSCRPS